MRAFIVKNRAQARYRLGLRAETLACWFLRAKLYRILARRFKTSVGEIDIIAVRGQTLAIVEVKARPSHARAAAAIAPVQQKRLIRAARFFLARHPAFASDFTIRFDAVLIAPRSFPLHIENAFQDHPQLF